MKKKTLLIIGATSLIAERCIQIWLHRGDVGLVKLVARDDKKLQRIESDLKVRAPLVKFERYITKDFISSEAINNLVEKVVGEDCIDLALIAHGSLSDQLDCQQDIVKANNEVLINGLSPILFAEKICSCMALQNKGTLAVISSVAGDRGRKSNYFYGAAKSLVNCFVQGLQHRLSSANVHVVLVKPGPTETPMTYHLADKMKLANVDEVSKTIVRGIEQGRSVVYAPSKWRLIMLIIRFLPRFIFNKLDI